MTIVFSFIQSIVIDSYYSIENYSWKLGSCWNRKVLKIEEKGVHDIKHMALYLYGTLFELVLRILSILSVATFHYRKLKSFGMWLIIANSTQWISYTCTYVHCHVRFVAGLEKKNILFHVINSKFGWLLRLFWANKINIYWM